MSHIYGKSHNKTILLYHIVFSIKYRRDVLTNAVTSTFVEKCKEIENTYKIEIIEIGCDGNHVHLLIQIVPSQSLSETVRIIKSITARAIFERNPEVKQQLWGGQFWSDGYWAVTVSREGTENLIRDYVKNQGCEQYDLLHREKFEPEF